MDIVRDKKKGVGDREREKKIGTLQGGSCALPSLTRAQRQKNLEKKNVCRLTNSAHIKVSSLTYRIHEEWYHAIVTLYVFVGTKFCSCDMLREIELM